MEQAHLHAAARKLLRKIEFNFFDEAHAPLLNILNGLVAISVFGTLASDNYFEKEACITISALLRKNSRRVTSIKRRFLLGIESKSAVDIR